VAVAAWLAAYDASLLLAPDGAWQSTYHFTIHIHSKLHLAYQVCTDWVPGRQLMPNFL